MANNRGYSAYDGLAVLVLACFIALAIGVGALIRHRIHSMESQVINQNNPTP